MVTRVTAKKATPKARSTAQVVQKSVADAVVGTLGLHGERMSKVDTAWLRMDTDSNLMMIVGVWVIKPGIRYDDLAERLEERLLRYPRFVQCAVEDAAGATWIRDRNFSMSNHLVVEKLPRTAVKDQQKALQDRLAKLCMEPLDRTHPLWRFHLVEHYKGGSALMVRIHHCIADGIALISVTNSLMDGGKVPPMRPTRLHPHGGLEGAEDWFEETLLKPLTSLAVKALGAAGEGAARSFDMMADPQKGVEKGLHGSVDAAKLAFQMVGDLAALALMPDDSHTSLKGLPGKTKRVA